LVRGCLELPVVRESLDLPLVREPLDLPLVRECLELPVVRESLDLPLVRESLDLPVVRECLELPVVRESLDLPLVRECLELPVVRECLELPVVRESLGLPLVGLSVRPGEIHTRGVNPRWIRAHAPVTGGDIMVVDDTWVSGGSAQSAAAALKLAGARRVAIVVLGRHVNPDDPRSVSFLDAAGKDFSAWCPPEPSPFVLRAGQ
jgi:hypothetical protein